MIDLSFRQLMEGELETEEAPELAPAAAIEHTYFVVPVRLAIGGEELLAYPGVYTDWRPLPILGFATQLLRTVAELEQGQSKAVTLADGGLLVISRDSDRLVVAPSLCPVSGDAPRDELVQAVSKFARAACEYVLSLSPAMAGHPDWGRWCRAAR